MALSRFSINLVFGVTVAALGLTACVFLYLNSEQHDNQAQAAESSRLPDKHPPIDSADRIAALQRMIASEPRNPEHRTQIGNLYYDLGQYDKAVEYYQQSLEIHPRDPNVETDLAVCFHYMGQDDKSLELLDKVLGYNAGFSQAKFNKGTVLIEGKKDVKRGIAVWEDLLRSDPDYSEKIELEQRINKLKASIR